ARPAEVRFSSPTTGGGRYRPQHDVIGWVAPYDWLMLRAVPRLLRDQLRRRSELIPVGITWTSFIAVDIIELLGWVISTLQRPVGDVPVALAAFAMSVAPTLLFFFFNMKLSPTLMWASWSMATGLMLFATSTPVHADFAPALLVLMVLSVATLSSVAGGFL